MCQQVFYYTVIPKDKVYMKGQNLGRVFNFRFGHVRTLICTRTKQPNFKLKTRPKQLLGSLLLAFQSLPPILLFLNKARSQLLERS
jgi:hypothetical protein